jgi:hypothetical protein
MESDPDPLVKGTDPLHCFAAAIRYVKLCAIPDKYLPYFLL